ncbi:EAL domain-containing protein [Massilia sp. TW-1]|uniref:EAL domain-containing protein n=1 Tax=Telluria antibiotica TaxID=2717319 RepID=A0ABX0P721_9BURK|nr:GGDEF domain-containing phosphodiesterase [Telluria antibiotica]NIA52090.1 EAL domain-containing protein [Telluria antibiotica]
MLGFDDIAQWRARIFSRLLAVVLVLGTIAAIPSVFVVVRHGVWTVAVMDGAALAWLFALWRLERVPYTFRVLNFLAIIYMVAICLMLNVGPVSQNYLMAPPVMAAMLLGTVPSLLALAASAVILVFGITQFPSTLVGLGHDPLVTALLVTLNFSCVGALLTLSCGALLKGLSRSLDDVRGFAKSLESGQDALHAVNAELRLTSAALARLNDMVLIARAVDTPDRDLPIIFSNEAFQRRTGYTDAEIVGRSMRVLHGPGTDPAVVERIIDSMHQGRAATAEMVNYTKAGDPYWVEMELMPFTDDAGHISHWVVVGRDITERRHSADAIHRLAYYDVLTGLPNRRLMTERLDAMVAAANAGRGLGAVLYIDLDNFKHVNDARGHATGDALLKHTAKSLANVVRKGDTVARLGGDEFVVLLEGLGTDAVGAAAAALAVSDKIRAALAEDVTIDDQAYRSTASIGVALPTRPGQSVADLLRDADLAMYHAKAAGRNGAAMFETSMLAAAERQLTLGRDLSAALANGELSMHLQLQVDHAGTPVGAEMLMRWRRGDGTFVPPDVFIPVAETTGMILPLGLWVLRQACLARLALEAAGHPLQLSINVSPRQFRQPEFVAQVRAAFDESGVPPQAFVFEVTEGLLVEDFDMITTKMRELAALGIRFSIDDFGTGYSSLGYLKKMPLYELKIDKSFMRDTPHDANGTAIVQTILAMADHLGLRVVAEGIETEAQARFLADNGRPCMQGYLYCRPLPLDDLVARLNRGV